MTREREEGVIDRRCRPPIPAALAKVTHLALPSTLTLGG